MISSIKRIENKAKNLTVACQLKLALLKLQRYSRGSSVNGRRSHLKEGSLRPIVVINLHDGLSQIHLNEKKIIFDIFSPKKRRNRSANFKLNKQCAFLTNDKKQVLFVFLQQHTFTVVGTRYCEKI